MRWQRWLSLERSLGLMMCSRSFVAALTALLMTMNLTRAQEQSKSFLERTWHHFLDRCSLAYTDMDEYLRTIGEGTNTNDIGSTLDRNVSWANAVTDIASVQTTTLIVGERRVQDCYVQGVLEGDQVRSEALNVAFLHDLEARPGLTVAGGPMPPTTLGAGGAGGIEEGTYGYVIVGVLPQGIVTEVYISPWYFEALSVHMDAIE